MGKAHKTTHPEPDALQSFLDGDRDSTLADLAASRNTFREFVIYDADQVYPEYVILYKRLHQDAEPEPLPKELPFLLELPLYWKNVCENPHHPGFREHCFVKPQIHDLIKRLANGTASIGGPYEVVKVTRVEDSILWLRYMETKGQLTELAKRTPFKLPNDSWNQLKKTIWFLFQPLVDMKPPKTWDDGIGRKNFVQCPFWGISSFWRSEKSFSEKNRRLHHS